MRDRYIYHKGDKDFFIKAYKNYASNKQEIDKLLECLITPYIADKELKILDAASGVGHLCKILSEISPNSKLLGVDQTPYLVDEARKLFGKEKNIFFEIGDVEDLPAKYFKNFDVSVCWKTLSWLPYYHHFMKALFAVTQKHIFVSSLFYEGDIDFITKVREFQMEAGRNNDFSEYRNVYSLPQFKKFVTSLGAKNIEVYDFDINIDVHKKESLNFMSTYTVKLQNGKRLQISGAVLMNWKIVRIDL